MIQTAFKPIRWLLYLLLTACALPVVIATVVCICLLQIIRLATDQLLPPQPVLTLNRLEQADEANCE